jgi:branched-chain amino acid aminotransferase
MARKVEGEVMAEPLVWVNDRFVPKSQASISVFDHGLLYGDGCFEGIKSWDGKVFKLKEHIERFYASAHFLDIKLLQSQEEMAQICLNSFAVNELHEGVAYARLVATRGVGDLGINPRKCKDHPTIICIASTIQLYPKEMYEDGIKVITASIRRTSVQALPARVKSLNYLNNILAVMEANRAGAGEAIMLTQTGYVSEATADNIFFVKNGVIHTPSPYLGILEGITRNSIMEIARREGLTVNEGTYLTYDLYNADECWLTGTGADLIPVVEIDGRAVASGKPGPIFTRLRSRWMDYVNEAQNHAVVPARETVLAD